MRCGVNSLMELSKHFHSEQKAQRGSWKALSQRALPHGCALPVCQHLLCALCFPSHATGGPQRVGFGQAKEIRVSIDNRSEGERDSAFSNSFRSNSLIGLPYLSPLKAFGYSAYAPQRRTLGWKHLLDCSAHAPKEHPPLKLLPQQPDKSTTLPAPKLSHVDFHNGVSFAAAPRSCN